MARAADKIEWRHFFFKNKSGKLGSNILTRRAFFFIQLGFNIVFLLKGESPFPQKNTPAPSFDGFILNFDSVPTFFCVLSDKGGTGWDRARKRKCCASYINNHKKIEEA